MKKCGDTEMAEKKNKVGRPEKYTTHVLPFLSQIEAWWINGNTNLWIAEQLGISDSYFQKCVAEKKELKQLKEEIPRKRVSLVEDLKQGLIQRGKGMEYEESKTILVEDEVTKKPKVIRKEIYKKKALPDPTAAKEALFMLGVKEVSNRASYEMKREQFEWQKEKERADVEWVAVNDDFGNVTDDFNDGGEE